MTPEDTSPLERLAAALMLVDPAATIAHRAPRLIQLKLAIFQTALIDAREVQTFEADLRGLVDAVKPGQSLMVVAVVTNEAQRADFESVIKRVLPSVLLQLRSQKQVHLWTPGHKPVAVRGSAWRPLTQAIERLDAGEVADATAITAQRGEQADAVQAFMAPLAARQPWVTWSVAVLSLALFGLQLLWGNGEPYVAAPRMGALLRSLIEEGQVWRLLAPMLLHGSIAHVLMNMIALFSFGTFLERLLGWRRYLLLYVLSGLGGSIASALRAEDVLSVGASGGIWGLMLAGAVLVTWPRGRLPAMVSKLQRRRAWIPVGLNALFSFQPGIDLLAHFGGGAIGGLLVFSGLITAGIPAAAESNDPARPPLREPVLVTAGAALCSVLLLGALAAALFTGRPWELQSSPALHMVSVSGAALQLPNLIAPATVMADGRTHTFGSLKLDPVAFVVGLPDTKLSDEEAKDPEGQLRAAVPTYKPGLYPGFTQATASELRHHDGRPYLFHQQTASDGRVASSYLLLDGARVLSVQVLSSSGASGPWRAAANAVPFSIRYP